MILRSRERACRRFESLSEEGLDRSLTSAESQFLDAHRETCENCRRYEEQGALALNMLRQTGFEPEYDDSFDRRLIRRAKAQTVRDGFRYWSPVALGATIAMIGVLAVLQVSLKSDSLPERRSEVGEAMRRTHAFPEVPELVDTPKLTP